MIFYGPVIALSHVRYIYIFLCHIYACVVVHVYVGVTSLLKAQSSVVHNRTALKALKLYRPAGRKLHAVACIETATIIHVVVLSQTKVLQDPLNTKTK